jgi:hypothetical protein
MRKSHPPFETSISGFSAGALEICLPRPGRSTRRQAALIFRTLATRTAPRPLKVDTRHDRPASQYSSVRIGHTQSIAVPASGKPPSSNALRDYDYYTLLTILKQTAETYNHNYLNHAVGGS